VLIVGLIVFAAAVASAVILIVQNRGSVVGVHALGHTWTGHLYWVLVAGLIIALVGVVGLAILRGGAARARRLRRQRAALLAENKRLSERVRDPATSSFFVGTGRADTGPALSSAAGSHPTGRRHIFRRGHHAV
jgi:hypothetical protein